MSEHSFFTMLESSLDQLQLEFKHSDRKSLTYAERSKLSSVVSQLPSGQIIPLVSPKRSEDSSKGSIVGVNHLNLIQIKGRAAHSWQPILIQASSGEVYVVRPSRSTFEVNSILLKASEAKKN